MRNVAKSFKKGSQKNESPEQNKEDISRFIDEGNPNTQKKINEAKTSQPRPQLDEDEEIDLSIDIPSNDEEKDI